MVSVGISYNPSLDLFYSGVNQTALTLVELFLKLGYKITLVDTTNCDVDWWDSFPRLEGVDLSKLYKTTGLDFFIDIDGFANPDFRKTAATQTIIFLRTFLQFAELDNSVYPDKSWRPRSFENVSEIWCWDILNPDETIPSIQTLFPCPIRTVPFIWSPLVANHYHNHSKDNSELTIHIAEKNINNFGSSILSLVAVRELESKKIISAKYKCHNMERIMENRFLKENILNNIEVEKLPVAFAPKEHFYKWGRNDILFSHNRFTPLRIGLLNAIWLGVPIVHNSPILQSLHPILDMVFYFGNNINQIVSAFTYINNNSQLYLSSIDDLRKCILANWGIDAGLEKWKYILKSPNPNPTQTPNPNPKYNLSEIKPNQFFVAFSDMWPGFNYDKNFITDALRHENQNTQIFGFEYGTQKKQPNVLIFGPYSSNWKTIPNNIPKIYFSAENWPNPSDNNIALHLTCCREETDTHIRIPTWMTFIDWFSTSTTLPENSTDNPIRLPLHFAKTPHHISFHKRPEFCGFVVSNPTCTFRNECFMAVNNYKPVNSGGALFNNIGGQLSLKYPGGGGGDISKYQFFTKHKFILSFENSQSPGYITEKVLHAKMAGCVPIYWGDDDTTTDFASGSIVNISKYTKPEYVVKLIQRLEENPDMCSTIASTPLLNEEKVQKALGIISKMARKIFEVGKINCMPSQVDKIYLINLDTRSDRLDSLFKAEPYLKSLVSRVPGVNGQTLKLNKFIYNLFMENQFKWKKSIIGCNLSHISVWSKIANEKSGKYFLVLEDDVRFQKDWIDVWTKCAEHIPNDADILYLGGVLPPNKVVLPYCMEKVNEYWCQITPNTYFSPTPLPIFHFCAYSYILSRNGAEKIMNFLTNSKMKSYTVSDHLLGSPHIGLKKYFTNPLLSYCFQEEDPVYLKSEFNDLHRKDTFDSDIWNNTECFSEEELIPFRSDYDINIFHLNKNTDNLFEQEWLENIFGRKISMKPLSNLEDTVPNNSWFFVQRPNISVLKTYFEYLRDKNIDFKVIHLSDEFGLDDIEFYNFPNCKAVVRNYLRKDISKLPHVFTIPLGYHYKGNNLKSFTDRQLIWSFHGTNWFNRKDQLQCIADMKPNSCYFTDSWDDPNKSKKDEYLSILEKSKFCPILRGNNIETFRLYEALEAGSIPIYIRMEGDEEFWNLISSKLQLIPLESWQSAIEFIKLLNNNTAWAEKYRQKIIENWTSWKNQLKQTCSKLI